MRHLRTPAAVLLLSLAPLAAAAQNQAASGTYQIGPGDVLDIIVWRNRELTLPVTVRPDGWISFPVVGDLRAAGSTPTALQAALERGLAKSVLSPAVTVLVTRVAGFKVSVLGKVRQPGRFDVHENTTVLDLLALAGGPNEFADPDQMYVLREAPTDHKYERIPVRYSASIVPGRDNANTRVKPGDIVVVP